MANRNLKKIKLNEFPLILQIFMIVVVCFAVFYYLYNIDITSAQRHLASYQSHEQDLKIQVEAFLDNLQTLDNDIAELPQLQKILNELRGNLVKPAELPDLLSEILKQAAANNLQVDTFTPGAEVNTSLYVKVPIKMVVKGDYEQIANFVSQVANMSWIVVIGNFTISKEIADKSVSAAATEVSAPSNHLVAEITLEVYYLAEKSKK